LEGFAVVLGSRVDFGYAIDDLAERNPAPVVTNGYKIIVNGYLDAFAMTGGVFIDGIIDDLLEKDIDAVVGRGAVAELADVHARPEAHVFSRAKGFDVRFGVVRFRHLIREIGTRLLDESRGILIENALTLRLALEDEE